MPSLTPSAYWSRRRSLLTLLVALAAVAIAIAIPLSLTSRPQATGPRRGWHLVWSSNFNGPAGTVPSGWTFETGGSGWGNHEQEYYVDGTQDEVTHNAVLNGHGDLAISVRRNADTALLCSYDAAGSYLPYGETCAYTSARLDTSAIPAANPTYGRIEARIRLPQGAGIWPAFWALGSDFPTVGWPGCGEIDVMETFSRTPGTVYAHLHGPTAADPSAPWHEPGNARAAGYTLPDGQAFSSGFHVFAASWYPGHISFSVDGHVYETIDRANLPSGDAWVFDRPFYLLLNVAVGSALSPSGAPDAATVFPQTMLVNWVRVYSAGAGT
jgi:beta-glucanase (GH16 family)